MASLSLVIGDRDRSSWSLRAWLILRMSGLAFDVIHIPLRQADSRRAALRYSPSGLVPALIVDGTAVWESLAVAECVAELTSEVQLWPEDPVARAVARSVSAEMHAGFRALRENMFYDVLREPQKKDVPPAVVVDIARIIDCWRECRKRFGLSGPFLFGRWSIADAMFAPVVNRFKIYQIDLDDVAWAYCDTVSSFPAVLEWEAQARAEL